MNTPVNFEIAKLLKEKGYNKIAQNLWHFNGSDCIGMSNKNSENFGFSAPTIAEVVMWLYEKHGIWVYPFRHNFNNEFYWHIDTPHEDEFTSDMNFKSPTEAYEAGIEYTLKNLL